jgi:hypothetical protein
MLKLEYLRFYFIVEVRSDPLIGGHVDVLFEQPGDVRRFLDAG